MNIVEINSCNYGSTGTIMLHLAEAVRANGDEAITCYPVSRSNKKRRVEGQLFIGNRICRNIDLIISRITGISGVFSCFPTIAFLKKIEKEKPAIIHLHNLHNGYINLPILFHYIKHRHIPVVWTFHDCWPFTGQCPHFTLSKCDRWKTGCHDCPSFRQYPATYVDRTQTMWKLKRSWFTGVEKLTIVTPSQWLADLVKQSFLKEYPVKVIHNGIDLSIFQPTPGHFREKYNIPSSKFLILGVAFGWGRRKGLDVFEVLSKRLDPGRYQIVLVGTDDAVDRLLPDGILSIHRTSNPKELAEIYTAADLFVNPTREEVLGLVNIEAIACGTPVLTFQTGGCPEVVTKETGAVVDCDDIQALIAEIERISNTHPYSEKDCRERAAAFDRNAVYKEYLDLFSNC